tara:strand:+ start:665 stop:955 length:291 start_codon:yes stop_codon:yes gene_type:complete
MKTLHTISKSPSAKLLDSCLEVIDEKDGLLFLEDGVYFTLNGFNNSESGKAYNCYALKEDLFARGIELNSSGDISVIDYPGFVDLCEHYEKIVNWF